MDDGTVFVHNKICIGDTVEIIPVHGKNQTLTIQKIIKNNEELSEFSAGNNESYVTLVLEGEKTFEPKSLIVKNYSK